MVYSDELEHTAALSELIDAWVRGWARRYVSRRNCQRRSRMDQATKENRNHGRGEEVNPTCSYPMDAAEADG